MNINDIAWSVTAEKQFVSIIEYVAQHSIQSAELIPDELKKILDKIKIHPKMYPADKYKIKNNGSKIERLYYSNIVFLIK